MSVFLDGSFTGTRVCENNNNNNSGREGKMKTEWWDWRKRSALQGGIMETNEGSREKNAVM